jgi:signal transduction histidine kinase
VLWLVTRRPAWLKPLSWVVLAVLFLDVLDGLWPPVPPAIRSTHVLMPMLVLYGALLCDIAITLVAMAGVLALCVFTWLAYGPLAPGDSLMLFDVVLATALSGATSLGIWMHHRRLMRELRQQAEELRIELETNNRLSAVISHDIANPLSALMGTLELARLDGGAGADDVSLMERMAGRIAAIIDTMRAINADRLAEVPTQVVTADWMESELREVFSGRLAAKNQTLALTAGSGLGLRTIPGILLNSVLGTSSPMPSSSRRRGAPSNCAPLARGSGCASRSATGARAFPRSSSSAA